MNDSRPLSSPTAGLPQLVMGSITLSGGIESGSFRDVARKDDVGSPPYLCQSSLFAQRTPEPLPASARERAPQPIDYVYLRKENWQVCLARSLQSVVRSQVSNASSATDYELLTTD